LKTFQSGRLGDSDRVQDFHWRVTLMKFFQLLILIGANLALGIVGIFSAKLLLGMMPKSLVVLILATVGFVLVRAVIRINTPKPVVRAEHWTFAPINRLLSLCKKVLYR
jgi:hypothetical protein